MSENYTRIDLTDVPVVVAESLNIDLFAGKLICSAILIMIFLIPISMIVKSKYGSWIPEMSITLIVLGICIGIGWLDAWIFILLCVMVGLGIAVSMRKIITGGQ